jgi:RNA polymerase sigma-70 factor, ECF subfamily
MATTVASISCPQETVGPPHQKRVQELTDVITRYLPCLHRMALRRLGNVEDAEDAVQDALLSALTHVGQFRGQAQMSTWLTAILINSVRMKLRQRPRRVHILLDEKDLEDDELSFSQMVPDLRPGPEEICRWWELTDLLFRLMKRLSPTLRRTFQLRAVDGLSIRETANVLRVPEGTAKARIARARARLKQMVEEHVGGNRARSAGIRMLFRHRG